MEDKDIKVILIGAGIEPSDINLTIYRIVQNQIEKELVTETHVTNQKSSIPKRSAYQEAKDSILPPIDYSIRLIGTGVNKPTFI